MRRPPGAGHAPGRRMRFATSPAERFAATLAPMNESTLKRYLPWVVATALFMEQLDSTIVNTAVPAMAQSLHVTPLSLKAVVASYILALAVCIPVSGWMADRFGTRRVFAAAVALFTASSALCGLAVNLPMLVAARVVQGVGAAMMMPVGRLTVVRTFPKSELLKAMNFVIMPALIGPLLGPTVGGLIVHWLSWREIFFVNLPVGLVAQWLIHRHMPDYRGEAPRPLDVIGLVLFGSGVALLSWLLEIFGEHVIGVTEAGVLLGVALTLLAAYGWHAGQVPHPLLRLDLFKVRTFRIAVMGGFVTRLGIGGVPFLLPLFYQLGLGRPAWQSGLLMMPTAAAAMGMKLFASRILARFGYRQVLAVNTVMIGVVLCLWATIGPATPLPLIVLNGLAMGFFNSLQFSSMNTLGYADMSARDTSMASTIASSLQQLSMSFGLAMGTLMAGWFLGNVPQSDRVAVTGALHHAFIALGVLTMLSSLSFRALERSDGESVSRGAQPKPPEVQASVHAGLHSEGGNGAVPG